jgi:hypothetical protein
VPKAEIIPKRHAAKMHAANPYSFARNKNTDRAFIVFVKEVK